jgi:ribosomal protein L37E
MNESNTPIKINCPECGAPIESISTVCSECGFPIEKPQVERTVVVKKPALPAKQLGIVFCVVAVICFIIGITRIANDDYAFYSGHYKECAEGYEDATREANTAGWLLQGTYEYIADSYQDMMNDDLKKIWTFRIEATVLCAAGVVLIIFGVKKIKKNTGGTNGTN